MPNQDLEKYITSAREQKIPDDQIKEQLTKVGWGEKDVVEALAPKPEATITLPPPPVPHVGMWVTFQYVILFISLYISATSLGQVLHFLVDKYIPDALDNTGYGYYDSFFDGFIRIYLAALIVVFPVFALLFLMAKKQIANNYAIKSFRVRKTLIYITLVGTFLIMIYKLVHTVYSLLGGEITTRFGAHFLITFVISASIFFYLLNDVKEDRKSA